MVINLEIITWILTLNVNFIELPFLLSKAKISEYNSFRILIRDIR